MFYSNVSDILWIYYFRLDTLQRAYCGHAPLQVGGIKTSQLELFLVVLDSSISELGSEMFFYFTGNGYWMGWNTLCLWRYCINEVIWALIFSKNEKEQISLTFYIIEISVLFSRSCGRSSSSGSRALFLLLLSPSSLLHLGCSLPCCSRLCPLSDKG